MKENNCLEMLSEGENIEVREHSLIKECLDNQFFSCEAGFNTNDLRKTRGMKWKPGTAEVKQGFLIAGCDRMTDGVMKCLATFRVWLGGQSIPSKAVKNIMNREEGKYFCVGTESLFKMAVGNKERNGMSVS